MTFEGVLCCNSRQVYPEEGGSVILQYDGTHVPDHTVSGHNATIHCKAKL
jgi:hypothetical protein